MNSVSSGIQAGTGSKQESTRTPMAQKPGPEQRQFMHGTRSMLDDARAVAENAVGQGMQLNPIIYQMLGLKPTMADNSGDLTAAQTDMDAAQAQYDQARAQLDQLNALPKGKRSKEQRKQIRQLKKGMASTEAALEHSKEEFNRLQTMPNTITGFERMDPNDIPAESPFSALNPLNKAQQTEAGRLNDYLAGGEVDPTLKHQWTSAEQALRAQLTQRFGPDFENTSVGQMALQNFSRDKNEAFATWNQQQVERYNNMAFGGAANLQQLLAGQIGLMREPSGTQMGNAANLSNMAGARLQQEQTNLQERAARQGMTVTTAQSNPIALAGSGLSGIGQLLKTPYNSQGDTLGGAMTGSNAAQPTTVDVPTYGGGSQLTNWATTGGGEAVGEGTVMAPSDTGVLSWL